jgi:hypothetical protein
VTPVLPVSVMVMSPAERPLIAALKVKVSLVLALVPAAPSAVRLVKQLTQR